MKKTISIIIAVIIYISNFNNSFASNWYIENLLDLNTWIEVYNIDLPDLEYVYFYNNNLNNRFNDYVKANEVLKNIIIRKYKKWDFDYYQMQAIVTNYKKYVYYSNKLFYYISIKESNPYYYVETDDAILSNYKLTKSYYKQLKRLIYMK